MAGSVKALWLLSGIRGLVPILSFNHLSRVCKSSKDEWFPWFCDTCETLLYSGGQGPNLSWVALGAWHNLSLPHSSGADDSPCHLWFLCRQRERARVAHGKYCRSVLHRQPKRIWHIPFLFGLWRGWNEYRSPCSLVAMVTNALIVQLDGFTKTTPLSVSPGHFSRFLFVAMMKQSG